MKEIQIEHRIFERFRKERSFFASKKLLLYGHKSLVMGERFLLRSSEHHQSSIEMVAVKNQHITLTKLSNEIARAIGYENVADLLETIIKSARGELEGYFVGKDKCITKWFHDWPLWNLEAPLSVLTVKYFYEDD